VANNEIKEVSFMHKKRLRESFKEWFYIGLALVILGGIVFAIIIMLKYMIIGLQGLESSLAVGLLTAATTIIVSVVTVLLAKYLEKKKELEAEIRNKKIPVYEELISFFMKVLNKEINPESKKDKEKANEFFINLTQKLIVWGSDEVIKKWSFYRKNADDKTDNRVLFYLEELLFAIREDVGHDNEDLTKGDLLSLFINDM